jgi:hypothetical protein
MSKITGTGYYARLETCLGKDDLTLVLEVNSKGIVKLIADDEVNSIKSLPTDCAIIYLFDECSGTGSPWGNNWRLLTDKDKENLGHLTEAPMIGYDCITDEETGEVIGGDYFWYDANYQTVDVIDELLEKGSYNFKKV